MNYKIYKITNTVNGKSYIGQTMQDVSVRFGQHKSDSKNRGHLPLHNAIKKYGRENFILTILADGLTKDQASKREKGFIKIFNSLHKNNGYNISTGGEAGPEGTVPWCKGLTKNSNPILARISEKQMGKNNSFFGKTHSDENKRKWSKTRRGENHGMFGTKRPELSVRNSQRIWTKEQKNKMSQIKKTSQKSIEATNFLIKKAKEKSKKILCHQNNTVYDSFHHAARELNLQRQHIKETINGKISLTKGYSFEYYRK